jgi:hypothetical protein
VLALLLVLAGCADFLAWRDNQFNASALCYNDGDAYHGACPLGWNALYDHGLCNCMEIRRGGDMFQTLPVKP